VPLRSTTVTECPYLVGAVRPAHAVDRSMVMSTIMVVPPARRSSAVILSSSAALLVFADFTPVATSLIVGGYVITKYYLRQIHLELHPHLLSRNRRG